MRQTPPVRTGLDVLRQQGFAALRGLRIGLVTHPAAVDARLQHVSELLAAAPQVQVTAIFGPEHGVSGHAQDLTPVWPNEVSSAAFPRVYSLYGPSVESLRPTPEMLRGLDALLIDLQDVGSRYYTFQATMLFCMEAASRANLLTIILDRPNPLGGAVVEGPLLQPGFESFVGIHPIPTRHGMTIGELARLYQAERALSAELRIIPCEGWRRAMDFDATGLPWVLPSPNMPTVETAFVYPGQCLLEGTNLSEGRGTTRPFELCGAPWLDAPQLANRMCDADLPGVVFRPACFQPTFQKFAGQICGGVQLHITDRETFQPVRTSLELLAAMREQSREYFDWRREPYEFVADRLAIDLLFGSDRERRALEAEQSTNDMARAWEQEEIAFRERRRDFLMYD